MLTDGKYDYTYHGIKKVELRQQKRRNNLVASRAELVELNIEATFEVIVQTYIMYPTAANVIERFMKVVEFDFSTWELKIHFELSATESLQLFSILTSVFSLAFNFAEYSSAKKDMYLDIFTSPISRIILMVYMILMIYARMSAFLLFSYYWSPGDIYPLMIFLLIHMIISAVLHIVFSEDIIYWKQRQYGKFLYNVVMNSFACIYFHNYFYCCFYRLDRYPL